MPRPSHPRHRGRGRLRPSPPRHHHHQHSDTEQDCVLYTPQHSYGVRPYNRIIDDSIPVPHNDAATNTPNNSMSLSSTQHQNQHMSKRQAQKHKKQAKREARRARKRGASHFVHTAQQKSQMWHGSDIDWGDEYDRAVDFVNESSPAHVSIFEPEQPLQEQTSVRVTYFDDSESNANVSYNQHPHNYNKHHNYNNENKSNTSCKDDSSDDEAEEINLDSIDLMSSFARSIVDPYPSPPHNPNDTLENIQLPDRILPFELDSNHFISSNHTISDPLSQPQEEPSTILSSVATSSASDSEHSTSSESLSMTNSDTESSESVDTLSESDSSGDDSDDESSSSQEEEEEEEVEENYYDRVGRIINSNSHLINRKMNRKDRKNLARAIEKGKDVNTVIKGKKPSIDSWDTTDLLAEKLQKAWSVDQNAKRERKKLRQQVRQSNAQTTLSEINDMIKSFLLHSHLDVYTFGPMTAGKRAGIHLLADEYLVQCKSHGNGAQRCPSIYRTMKSRVPKDERSRRNIDSIVSASLGQRGPAPYKRGGRIKGLWMALLSEGRQYAASNQKNNKKANNRSRYLPSTSSSSKALHHKSKANSKFKPSASGSASGFASSSRSLVGEGVDKINETNVGFRMLKQLGWTEGDKMGAGSHGTVDPLVAVIKTDRRGLGG